MKKLFLSLVAVAAIGTLVLVACSKENSKNGTTVKIRMTDNPVNAEAVNVDIQQIRVKFREDSLGGWMNLDTHAGVYDLLGLQNGVDTLLAIGVVPADTLKEIRFVLGANNSIRVAGIDYPLSVPSGSESGLKIKVDKRLNGTLDSLLIDFDAALSIHQTGNGDYQLRPVLKIK
ncbi:MAG: DUF4382 domain-containing protein [Sphingobacteriales bacterium]|nr:DUF4382 domain-containing protein [Sphingobacteriales bacterium]